MRACWVLLLALVAYVAGDIYFHNPRGSNDRLNEENTDRNNANRLFDSQNNAKGGYCYGPAMSYFEGSQLNLEWTSQHGCGINPNLYCNYVLQYTCSNSDAAGATLVRDGTTTDTIPDNEGGALEMTGAEYKFGMHEPYENYRACKTRERNMGLFIADRNLNNKVTAKFTRQNNNGNRHGYECPEERDYYPYWHPTPWRDIAIIAHDTDWCDFYEKESQNVKSKNYCDEGDGLVSKYNNEAACAGNGGTWTSRNSWGIDKPDCVAAPFLRWNHLGNAIGGFGTSYNWTLPTSDDEACIKNDNCNCAIRIRYNISTHDLGEEGNRPDKNFIDYTSNGDSSPVQNDEIKTQDDLPHQLALDTTQFGRTFQDRSFMFHIKPRPDGVSGNARLFNLNVKGKRGNIVQAYPAVEYDFTPSWLNVRVGDYIHFQWTGCDTNPANNAGEGRAKTDRSNIVQIEKIGNSHPATDDWIKNNDDKVLFKDTDIRTRFAYIDQEMSQCHSYEQLLQENNNDKNQVEQSLNNCMKLNAAPTPYFDGGIVKMDKTGTFYYMSSRNNNFTNRDQKGAISVIPLLPAWAIAIIVVGCVLFALAGGVAGATLYAKTHPHSGVARALNRF